LTGLKFKFIQQTVPEEFLYLCGKFVFGLQ